MGDKMKVVISIDSFKGSINSIEAALAIKEGILNVFPSATVLTFPLADGGEGTIDALCSNSNGKIINTVVTGPLGEKINSHYGIMAKNNTAVIEMAQAAGLPLVPLDKRNPMYTTTYGVGELIKDAILKGCRNFIIGIGGSATNDVGIGMLQALGFGFYDKNGCQVSFGAQGLKELHTIDFSGVMHELSECTFNVACDVNNPLYGKNGCSLIYGPQKGANIEEVCLMDEWIRNYVEFLNSNNIDTGANYPGCGAAGGLGFAFKSFLNANLQRGTEIIISQTGVQDSICDADIVITGEGRLDGQTVMGKAPIGIAEIAKKYNKLVIAFSGCVTDDALICNEHGIDAFFPILRNFSSLDEALDKHNATKNLINTSNQVFKLIKSIKNV